MVTVTVLTADALHLAHFRTVIEADTEAAAMAQGREMLQLKIMATRQHVLPQEQDTPPGPAMTPSKAPGTCRR